MSKYETWRRLRTGSIEFTSMEENLLVSLAIKGMKKLKKPIIINQNRTSTNAAASDRGILNFPNLILATKPTKGEPIKAKIAATTMYVTIERKYQSSIPVNTNPKIRKKVLCF